MFKRIFCILAALVLTSALLSVSAMGSEQKQGDEDNYVAGTIQTEHFLIEYSVKNDGFAVKDWSSFDKMYLFAAIEVKVVGLKETNGFQTLTLSTWNATEDSGLAPSHSKYSLEVVQTEDGLCVHEEMYGEIPDKIFTFHQVFLTEGIDNCIVIQATEENLDIKPGEVPPMGKPEESDTFILQTYYAHYNSGVITDGVERMPAYLNMATTGDVFKLSSVTPIHREYLFLGWSDGSNLFQPGDTIEGINSTLNLTAQWIKKTNVQIEWSSELPDGITPGDGYGTQYPSESGNFTFTIKLDHSFVPSSHSIYLGEEVPYESMYEAEDGIYYTYSLNVNDYDFPVYVSVRPPKKPTVRYVVDGLEYGLEYFQMNADYQDIIRIPYEPIKDGYELAGWYRDEACTVLWNLEKDIITQDITYLYPKWVPIESTPDEPVFPSSPSYDYNDSEPTYSPTLDVSDSGTIKVSPRTPSEGDEVTITPNPDAGYEVDKVIVTDRNGDEVEVTTERDGTYTFTQPRGRVTIEVTFVRIGDAVGTTPFLDVAENTWYYDAVAYIYENGLMSGTSANLFNPNATTTRAMIATMLYRLEGEPKVNYGSAFDDVDASTYYADPIAWAVSNGIVTGYDETTFGPNDAITREQMAAILYRYAQYEGYSTTASANLTGYVDASAVSEYAMPALQWASAEGLVTGISGNTLTPDGSATRAQVATIFMRFMEDVVG